jgi:hypothetical protein
MRERPVLSAFLLYAVLAVLFFLPGLVPGHTISGADYLWSAAPWNTSVPAGIPLRSTHPVIYGQNPVLVDPVTVFEPFLQYTKSQLPHIPLWDPYILAGSPYLADMQSAIFSPFSLPAYILPFWWSLSVIAVLKVLVASMGGFMLGRALKMRFAAAFLCGAVFGYGLFLIAWLAWPLANVFALIPWLLVATERLVRRPSTVSASCLALLVALQLFGGHPESSFDAMVATVAFFVLRVLQEPSGLVAAVRAAGPGGRARSAAVVRAARAPVVAFVLALAGGAALSAVALLPFLQLLHQSSDLTSRPRSSVTVPSRYFFSAFLPNYFPNAFKVVTGFYAGALPLMLAVAALARRRVERIAVAAFSAVCVLVVLGIQPFFGVVSHLPGFDRTYLTRLTILYLMGVALLAGWGLDDLMRRSPRRRVARPLLLLAAALVVFPIVVVLATTGTLARVFGRSFEVAWGLVPAPNLSQLHGLAILRLSALIIWVVFAALAAVLLYWRTRGGLGAKAFAVMAVVLVLGDLFRAGMGYNPAITQAQAQQPLTPAIRYLQRQGLARFAAVMPNDGIDPLPPNVNLRYGLYDARGYDFPVDARFGAMWTRYVAPSTPLLPLDTTAVPSFNLTTNPATLRVLDLLGVRELLVQPGQPPLELPGLRLVYQGRDALVYENGGALPRTWLVANQQVVRTAGQGLTAIGSSRFDPRQAVLTERPLPGLSTQPSAAGSPGRARITSYSAQGVSIQADAARTSELVISDSWFPGWRVTVDGRPARLDRVDYVLRGVPLAPGFHHVVFTYDPSSFRDGWLVSLAAAIVIAAALFVALLRHLLPPMRRRPAHAVSASRRAPPPSDVSHESPVADTTRSPPGR